MSGGPRSVLLTAAGHGTAEIVRRTGKAKTAPAGTPTSIVNRLNTEMNAIMKTKEMGAILAKLNAKPEVGSPENLSTFIAAETQKWAAVVNAANIKVD
jgi:tripartite-type tricarboxylate transporter receptor subunit TctC